MMDLNKHPDYLRAKARAEKLLGCSVQSVLHKGRPYPAVIRILGAFKASLDYERNRTPRLFGTSLGLLDKATGEQRHRLFTILWPHKWNNGDKPSSKDLTPAEATWLTAELVNPTKPQGGKWQPDDPEALQAEITALFEWQTSRKYPAKFQANAEQMDYYEKNILDGQAQSDDMEMSEGEINRRIYGVGYFLMKCGHQNSGFEEALGRPTCSLCNLNGKYPNEYTHKLVPMDGNYWWVSVKEDAE